MHRVFVFAGVHDADADDGGDEVDRLNDQREEDALDAEDGEERRAQDHGADVLSGGGLEDVRAAAGAIAHVVADQVGDDGGVAWIVLGNAGLDFADQVGADVGRLGVDAAAELCEEGDQGCAEAEADQLIGGGLRMLQAAEEEEEHADAEQRERDDHQAGNGAAAQGGLESAAQAGAGSAGRADIGPDGDEHAGKAGEPGTDGADQKADDDLVGEGSGERREPVSNKEEYGKHHGNDGDGAVLPGHERLSPLADGVGDFLHLLGSGINREDRAGEEKRDHEAQDADGQGAPQIRTAAVWGAGGSHLEPHGPQADILHASSPKELSWCVPPLPSERARGKAVGSRKAD